MKSAKVHFKICSLIQSADMKFKFLHLFMSKGKKYTLRVHSPEGHLNTQATVTEADK